MASATKPISTGDIAEDARNVVLFLKAIDSVLPSHIDDDLLSFLDGLNSNPMCLELLARALTEEETKTVVNGERLRR